MFGFSIQKLLFTILVIVVVWYGFKLLSRLQERRENEIAERRARPGRARGGRGGKADAGTGTDAEDMVECVLCGTYVAARHARSCGRDDCPYPG